MNKKVIIALSVVLVLAVGAIILVLRMDNDPTLPVVNKDDQNQEEVKNPDEEVNNEENKGTIPNIISKTGIIKETGKNKVIITGEKEREITIYITDETKIYGPDGGEREFSDLSVGIDITVDIDGDEFEKEDTKFDAMIIYISGK